MLAPLGTHTAHEIGWGERREFAYITVQLQHRRYSSWTLCSTNPTLYWDHQGTAWYLTARVLSPHLWSISSTIIFVTFVFPGTSFLTSENGIQYKTSQSLTGVLCHN